MPPRGWWTDLRISDVGFGSKADMMVKRGLNIPPAPISGKLALILRNRPSRTTR